MNSPAPSASHRATRTPARTGTSEGRALAFWVFLSVLHAQLALALMPSWSDGTYYDYGYLAAVLVPYFFLVRWKECALPPNELDLRLRKMATSPPLIVLVIVAIAAVTLLRMAQWADSGWRTPLWLHAFAVLGTSGWLLARLLGRKAIAFWGCAVVVLLAVPLPTRMEFTLIHGLTQGVLEFSLFVNRMMGLPLMSQGETIFANGIPLQVSDGCSGIRSFQSGIFAGFVLGEFLRLGAISRLVLLAAGLGLAFLMNGARVIYLVRHAVSHPGADLQKVHDVSGYVSLTLTFLLIAGVAWLLWKNAEASRARSDRTSGSVPEGPVP